jgi:molecular chaperone GrpE
MEESPIKEVQNAQDTQAAAVGSEAPAPATSAAPTSPGASTPEAGAGDTVEAQSVPDYTAMVAELEAALAEERARADKLLDQTQRMAAEYQNSRRRQETLLADEIERAASHLIRRLLPVIDDFDLAFAHVPPEIAQNSPWVEGFRQIQKKLHNVLAEEGVTVVPAEGAFDPTLHEAVTAEPSDSVPSGHIIATLRAGYTLKGKVLRPALVRVAA